MGRFAVVSCVLVAAVASCFFKPDPPGHGSGDAGVKDAPADAPSDAGCTGACSGDMLTITCPGNSPVVQTCGWGCLTGQQGGTCGAITPASGAIAPGDFDTAQLADASVTGTIDGDTGVVGSLRGSGSGVISGIDYHLAGNVAVFRVKSLQITGSVTLAGSHPIAIVSGGAITVGAAIDATGACTGTAGGPGGYAGGLANTAASGNGGGTVVTGNGGGGGGHGGSGGVGTAKNGNSPTPGGASFGDDTMLLGGGGGGGGGASGAGTGGGGGGALELVSNVSITLTSSGIINAGGCGAHQVSGLGGGGGAGGTIMLEAPAVRIDGALAVNGGGGGAGGNNAGSGSGANGRSDRMPAAGGIGPNGFTAQDGGSGAAGSAANGYANGQVSNVGGGGGGAVGRIRVTTRDGSIIISGTLSPAPTDGTTTTVYSAVVH